MRHRHFRFARRVGGNLQIFAEGAFCFIKILQSGSRIAEVKPEVGFDVGGIVDLAQNAQIFLGRRIIFFVVILDPEPLQNFTGHGGGWGRRHKIIDLGRERRPVPQIKIRGNDTNRREIVVLVLIELTRRLERGEGRLIVLCFERGLTDIVLRLCRDRALRKFFEKLAESIAHTFDILLLTEDERFVL